MRVFVTGATGFIGNRVVKTLVERGHDVVALVRTPQAQSAVAALKAEPVVGDMLAPESFREAARSADAIVHAAQLRFPNRVSRRFMVEAEAADAAAVQHLVQAAKGSKTFRLFVYTSGCWVYGDRGTLLLNEKSGFRPTALAQGHHRVGRELLENFKTERVPAAVLCPGLVYGPGGPFLGMYQALLKGHLRKIGGGKNYWSPVHVDDVAMAYALAIERAKPGEFYNVVDDAPVLVHEFLDFMCLCLKRLPLGGAPKWMAKIFMGGLLVESLSASFRVSNAKIRRDLAWKPRFSTFREGLPPVLDELRRISGENLE